jgi:hypothetical protein
MNRKARLVTIKSLFRCLELTQSVFGSSSQTSHYRVSSLKWACLHLNVALQRAQSFQCHSCHLPIMLLVRQRKGVRFLLVALSNGTSRPLEHFTQPPGNFPRSGHQPWDDSRPNPSVTLKGAYVRLALGSRKSVDAGLSLRIHKYMSLNSLIA